MTLAARAGAAVGGIDNSRFCDALVTSSRDGVTVWQARERPSGRPVLLKSVGRHSRRSREVLEREAAVLSVIGAHPHVHTLYERVQTPGNGLLLVFERCLGSFGEVFGHAEMPVQDVVSLGIRIAGALETSHRAGIVHTALSPATVLLTEWLEPVLTGFGRAVAPGATAFLDEPSVHTSPEVLLGEPVTTATDVYGLASILYWLVAGRPAIMSAGGEAAAAVSASVLCSSVTPILRADVPLDLSDLLVWSLAADELTRPPTATWFAEELRRIEKLAGWERTPLTVGGAQL